MRPMCKVSTQKIATIKITFEDFREKKALRNEPRKKTKELVLDFVVLFCMSVGITVANTQKVSQVRDFLYNKKKISMKKHMLRLLTENSRMASSILWLLFVFIFQKKWKYLWKLKEYKKKCVFATTKTKKIQFLLLFLVEKLIVCTALDFSLCLI